jgi:hypothetical protein
VINQNPESGETLLTSDDGQYVILPHPRFP